MSRIDTEEHRAALAAQRRNPDRPHIEDGPEPSGPFDYSSLVDELLARLADREGTEAPEKPADKEDEGMTFQRPRFDSSVSLGNLLTILGMFACFGVAYTHFVQTVAQEQAQIEANRVEILALRKEADDRVQKYVPTIEAQARENEVQDTRVQNIIVSMNSLRDIVTDLAKTVAQTHEDIAVLKAQLGRDKRGEAAEGPQR